MDHQVRTVAACKGSYVAGSRAPLIVMPTGAGKTITGCAIVDGAVSKGRRVLWLAHRSELVEQASGSMDKVRVPHGVIQAGRKASPLFPLQIASVQTLVARPGDMPPADVIVSDEAHHDTAATRREIRLAYPRCELYVGLTATPERGDKSPLGDVFDAMIAETSVAELMSIGQLVPCTIIAPPKAQKGLAHSVEHSLRKYGKRRDGRKRPAVVFCGTIEEARATTIDLKRAGFRVECVDGKIDALVRRAHLDAFNAGTLDVLVNVMCLTEGWDAPQAELMILARGCSAACTWLQMIGRVLRACPRTGKVDCIVDDLRGVVHVHGLPEEDRKYSLTGRGISREPQDKRASIAQCLVCGAVFLSGPETCSMCGASLPRVRRDAMKEQKAESTKITADNLTPLHVKKSYFDNLAKEARAKGWNPKSIGVRFKARYGHWPAWRLGDAAHA